MPEETKNPKAAEAPSETKTEERGANPVAAGARPMTDKAHAEFGENFDPATGYVRVYCLASKKWKSVPAVDAREGLYGFAGQGEGWKPGYSLTEPKGK